MQAFESGARESDIRYPLALPAQRIRRACKLWLGRILLALMPARGARVLMEGDPMHFGQLDRLLLAGHLAIARRRGDWSKLSGVQQRFWAGQGGALFNTVKDVADRFESWFLGPHQAVVDALAEQLGDGSDWHALVELGSGNGRALDFLSHRFAELPQLVGVDLNASAAAANTARYQNARLNFVAAEATAWVEEYARPKTVWFSNAGVLEYLTQSQVSGIYQHIARRASPALFALVEPLAPTHDLAVSAHSEINAGEHSYSHHHAALLMQAGWTICYQCELEITGIRWQLLVARVA